MQQIRTKLYGMYLEHSVWNWQNRWNFLIRMNIDFVWVTEFPLLEWNEEENRYTAMHHPFTMPMEEDLPLIESQIREESVQKHMISY